MNFKKAIILILVAVFSSAFACASNAVETAKNAPVAQKEKPAANEAKKPSANSSPVEETKQEERIEIWDGRVGTTVGDMTKTPNFSDKERELVANAVAENLDKIKKLIGDEEDFNCNSPDASLEASGEGSFTKPNTKQKIYLYRKCVDDTVKYPSIVNGIVITENNKIVVHYVIADIGSSYEMKVLPDVNKNGLSEFALNYSGTQAYYTDVVTLYELNEKGVGYLGSFKAFTNSPDEGEKDDSETAWKISVAADKTPVFYRETYKRKNNDTKWSLVKKDEKISLEKGETTSADFWKKL